MDLCNKLLLKCSLLIALSLALHIFTSPATTHNAMETTGHKTTRNNRKATTQQENNISNSYNNSSINANGNTSNNSSTISNRHNSTNSTVSDSTHHNSTVPSPRAEITTHQINVSATETNFATQFASAPTRAEVSTTLRPPVSTVHSTSKSTPAYFTTGTTIGNKTSNETAGAGLNNSETSLTILFSVVLGVIILIILGLSVYKMTRSKWAKYSHHPLHNEDTGRQFMVTDDTLVISGGLYDGPQIYNSTVTVLNEDHMFTYTPTQFRLEFLHEDPTTDHKHEATTFKTFNTTDQQP
ncbi:sialomucin core protein 24-like isoform X2 [Ictalurus furcatus]|uniref:sialomucin core protein 24-like isoform X2 n=1 Tax=Ictalurus furcatus TaxID=66913 RepID=UPI002350E4D3|nr:sialomucin core protein 24-like isoform X2 [Ictalurus furcatus]